MKIHEYQARELLGKAGIPVPAARVVDSVDGAAAAFEAMAGGGGGGGAGGAGLQVIKAQVFAGGRGKAGFVKLVKSAGEAREATEFMLSHRMVSVQTGPEGIEVKKMAGGGGGGDCEGILCFDHAGSEPGDAGGDCVGGGGRGN